MKSMKSQLALIGLASGLATSQAGVLRFDVGSPIPDGSGSGLVSSRTVSGETTITSFSVSLEISGVAPDGAFNGDLYVTLQHVPTATFAVLLNRVGKDAGNPFGYWDNGFNVELVQSGAPDIHTYRTLVAPGAGAPLTGTWAADNRNVDPALVLTGTLSPLTSLDDFLGIDPNGQWALFATDLHSGGEAQLDSWSLNINTVVIPEPKTIGLLATLGLGAWALSRRRQRPNRSG